MITIYGLVCPITHEIRYIGKTTRSPQARLYAHITESVRTRHSHKHRWISKCVGQGLRPTVWVLEEVAPSISWQDRERAWIKKAIEMGLSLTNQTAGGEGLDFLDDEAKASYLKTLSTAVKKWQKERPQSVQRLREGSKRSWAENKQARIAACQSGWTEESRAQHRAKMASISKTPEFRAAKSAGQKKAWERDRPLFLSAFADPECKAKQSESKKKAWRDPEKRARLMNRWTPEARAKQAEEVAARRDKIKAAMTPEVRARQAATLKETWARRKAAMGVT